jgi:hypothetical protein
MTDEVILKIYDKEEQYSSKDMYKAYQKYRKHRSDSFDLLNGLATGFVSSTFDAFRQTFFKTANEIVENEATKLVKAWVKNNPNAEWKD